MWNNKSRKIALIILTSILIVIVKKEEVDLSNFIVYSFAKQIEKYSFMSLEVFIIIFIVGLTYKNNNVYYNKFLFFSGVLGVIIVYSKYIINEWDLTNSGDYLKFSALVLVCIVMILFENSSMLIGRKQKSVYEKNLDKPIENVENLFERRVNQMNSIISIIEDNSSDNGYSICISGEWGSGKTSFINATIDKMEKERKKNSIKEHKVKRIYPIRINMMELDNVESLIKYFFNKIKTILKENGAYVGINSEYQELISSLAGTVSTEAIGGFIKNKLSYDTDYREELKNMSNSLNKILKKEKIIIIVDDVERCSKDTVMDVLFFIKEIAMLNRCIVIFLVDYNKLTEKCEENEKFFEKFFNNTINLTLAEKNDINSLHSNNPDIIREINEVEKVFTDKIEYIKNEKYLYLKAQEERDKAQEHALDKAEINYRKFCERRENPRQMKKVFEKYNNLVKLIDNIKQDGNMENEKLEEFLEKVKYKKQIMILSLIYGLFSKSYSIIESKGMYIYLDEIRKQSDDDVEVIGEMIYDEWEKKDLNDNKNFISDEKCRFINVLLLYPNELYKIVNGFTSVQEIYIDQIENGCMVDDVSFVRVMDELYVAKYKNNDEKIKIINKAYKAYKVYNNSLNFDDALVTLKSPMIGRSYDINIIEIFYNVFCNENIRIKNINKCEEDLLEIYIKYFENIINNVKSYLECYEILKNKKDLHLWNSGSYAPYSSFEKTLINFCEKCKEVFRLNINDENNSIQFLKNIINDVDKFYKESGIENCREIMIMKEGVMHNIKESENLLKLEKIVKQKDDIYIEENDYKAILENILEKIENNRYFDDFKTVNHLFNVIYEKKIKLNNEELKLVNKIIEEWYIKNKGSVPRWRVMFIKISEQSRIE